MVNSLLLRGTKGLRDMNLDRIVNRNEKPRPWAEGDNIPWSEPGFSERMLREHLSQAHDQASRSLRMIDLHVEWIHREVLSGQPSRIVDLCCGPGLYTHRLARLGHRCTGIDFSPASIAYAQRAAKDEQLEIRYELEDVRTAGFPDGSDLVMLLSGELNVFSKPAARDILSRAAECMSESGKLILEVHARGVLEARGREPRTWYSSRSGLWSDSPHICLQESFWDSARRTATTRYFVTDAATGETTFSSASYQDYSDDEYEALLIGCGFESVAWCPSLTGLVDDSQWDFRVLVAGRRVRPESGGGLDREARR
jgi:SAM-dependent methyltransferase